MTQEILLENARVETLSKVVWCYLKLVLMKSRPGLINASKRSNKKKVNFSIYSIRMFTKK